MNYFGDLYNLKPSLDNPSLIYRGESIKEYFMNDFCARHLYWPVWYSPEEEKEELYKDVFNEHLPNMLKVFNKRLMEHEEDRFVCGNDITIYDLYIGAWFVDVFLNPKAQFADGWKKAMEEHSTPRVNKYIEDFKEELAEYLERRPQYVY